MRKRVREIAETRMRCGYRGTAVLLRREGWRVNVKRVHRLYRLEGLQIRLKPPRRRVMAVSATLAAAASTINDPSSPL